MMSSVEDRPLVPQIVRSGDGDVFRVGPEHVRVVLASEATGGTYHVAEVTIDAPNFGPPYHVHEREDEMFMVLSGELTVTVDGVPHVLKEGDTAFAPRNIPHRFESGPDGVRFYLTVTGNNFERFYPRYLEAVNSNRFEAIPGIAAEHGITLFP